MSVTVLKKDQVAAVKKAARGIALWANSLTVEDFVGAALGLSGVQTAALFPTGDPKGTLAFITSELTKQREIILREETSLPTYVVTKSVAGVYQICGLLVYLQPTTQAATLGRLEKYKQIRAVLVRLKKGHHLEAVAAALIKSWTGTAGATRKSNDQGIDAHGSMLFVPSELTVTVGDSLRQDHLISNRVFVLASAKAAIGTPISQRPKLLNPAHIRELVGGWVIQRSEVGVWRTNGIRQLTPTQMILVTTYRLSEAAKSSCFDLGVCIWSIPELIYLICRFAPAAVFPGAAGARVNVQEFNKWWKPFDSSRTS